jgi:large subunit ribosomal protein L29
MKAREAKEMTPAELVERIEAEKANLNKLKVNHAVSPIENPQNIKTARRDIARMMTILHQKNNTK